VIGAAGGWLVSQRVVVVNWGRWARALFYLKYTYFFFTTKQRAAVLGPEVS
jgi:hypothetical protein